MKKFSEKSALLVLQDGTTFEGTSFGAQSETIGEVVFNTSMSGYQEILTDPSYKGQMVVMTYPEIGNYGVNREDVESWRPFVEGFIVKEYHPVPSNFRARQSLGDYLKKNGVVGIEGIDTRKLVRHLRDHGSQMGILSTADLDRSSLAKKVRRHPGIVGVDLVREVTCKKPYHWSEGVWHPSPRTLIPSAPSDRFFDRLGEIRSTETVILRSSGNQGSGGGNGTKFKVIAYDFGIKRNILRNLVERGCDVTVVPASTPAEEVLKEKPDGVFLSNGPGDPEPVSYAIENIRKILGKVPVFGICLGHQLMGLALGGKTYKLKFGHHGGNQPVMDLGTRQVEITAQNHNFAVDPDSLKGEVEVTHINLNDQTVEGMRHRKVPAFSVQYHPEASPGPHDSNYLFQRFVEMMKEGEGGRRQGEV